MPVTLTFTFVRLSMAALLLKKDLRQISIVDTVVAISITRELRRTKIACSRFAGVPSLGSLRIATRAKMVRPDAPKRESSVEMLTERMRHRFFVRLLRHNKRTPVMAYRAIAALSTWTSGITFALLWKC